MTRGGEEEQEQEQEGSGQRTHVACRVPRTRTGRTRTGRTRRQRTRGRRTKEWGGGGRADGASSWRVGGGAHALRRTEAGGSGGQGGWRWAGGGTQRTDAPGRGGGGGGGGQEEMVVAERRWRRAPGGWMNAALTEARGQMRRNAVRPGRIHHAPAASPRRAGRSTRSHRTAPVSGGQQRHPAPTLAAPSIARPRCDMWHVPCAMHPFPVC